MTEIARRRWLCPWCQTAYEIPASAADPAACPKCEAQRPKAPPEIDPTQRRRASAAPAAPDADELRLPIPPHAREPESSEDKPPAGSVFASIARITIATIIAVAVMIFVVRLFSAPHARELQRSLDESRRLSETILKQPWKETDEAIARAEAIGRHERPSDTIKLALLTFRWEHEHGFAIARGQVQNISGAPLKNVAAACTFYAEQRKFITAHESLTRFNPIMPGQISDFEVIETWNPEMRSCEVGFKKLLGGSIAMEDRRQK